MVKGITAQEAVAMSIVLLDADEVQRVADGGLSDGVQAVVNGDGPAINLAAARVLLGKGAEYLGMNTLGWPVYGVTEGQEC